MDHDLLLIPPPGMPRPHPPWPWPPWRSQAAGTRARSARRFGRLSDERGAATAEYAVATMAAVGFAGLLVIISRS